MPHLLVLDRESGHVLRLRLLRSEARAGPDGSMRIRRVPIPFSPCACQLVTKRDNVRRHYCRRIGHGSPFGPYSPIFHQ